MRKMQKSKGNMHLQPPATFWSAQAAQRHVTPSTQTGSRRIEAVFFIYLYLQITKCFSNIVLDISCIYQHLQHVGHQRIDSVPPRQPLAEVNLLVSLEASVVCIVTRIWTVEKSQLGMQGMQL